MAKPIGVVKQIENKITASVDKVEANAVPSMPIAESDEAPVAVTVMDRLINFSVEVWKMFWPLVIIAVILWHYEAIRQYYFQTKKLEPTWVGILKKIQIGMIGHLIAHVLRSLTFPYVKLRYLYRTDKETFRIVFLACAIWYGLWVVAMLLAV